MFDRLITYDLFSAVEIRIGVIVAARQNRKARKPAYVLSIDFGIDIGLKESSAQLTENYKVDELLGRQVLAIVNLPPRRVADINSEVLVLAAVAEQMGTVLVGPVSPVPNGTRIL